MVEFNLKKNNFGSIWLALTYNCTNRCKWCYASSNIDEFKKREFDISKENGLLNLLGELGVIDIKLVGGEPTLYKNLIPFLEKSASKGMEVTLVTNGRRLSNPYFARKLKEAGLKYASFSIEGYNKESHDNETCAKGSFDEAIQGMNNFRNLEIEITTNTTITSNNKQHLEKIVDFLAPKSRIITFNICEPWFKSEDYSNSILSPLEGAKEFERIYKYAKNKGILVKLTTPIPICNFDEQIREDMQKQGAIGGICSIISGQNFVIDYNGDVLPCTLFSGFPFFNIFKEGQIIGSDEFLKQYNLSEESRKTRQKIRHFPSKKCTNGCNNFCAGGCPIFWTKYNPNEQIKGC